MQPMSMTENATNEKSYGGGSTGQAEAVRMALARVMCEVNPEYRLILKPEGLLTRDPMVERKKFGQKKARKKFQFSKRYCLEYMYSRLIEFIIEFKTMLLSR
jgi:small subunit ribosomal protein S9